MIKQTILFAAATLFSLDACAGYVRYQFTSGATGFFVQNEEDKSIAEYFVNVRSTDVDAQFTLSYQADLIGVSTNFRGSGPTNFAAYNNGTEVYDSRISFNFGHTDTAGVFGFSAFYQQTQNPGYPRSPFVIPLRPLSMNFSGTVIGTALPDYKTEIVDIGGISYYTTSNLRHLVPALNEVPEPTSIALLMIGALGIGGTYRRRSAR